LAVDEVERLCRGTDGSVRTVRSVVVKTGLVPDRARALRSFLSRGEFRWVG